jgi:transcriptional regulator with XRE-family HTH domain
MEKPAFNYVRTLRQQRCLTERELAFLINRSQSTVSSIEYGDHSPTLDAALGLQILFRLPPKEMFPACYETVEERVMRRAAELIEKLEGEADRRSLAKLEFLEGLARHDSHIEL